MIDMQGSVILAGGIARDSELKYVGANQVPRCSFSVSIGRDSSGKSIFVNCVAWRALSAVADSIRVGDNVLVAGRTEEHEYNGKLYRNVVCDFIQILATDAPAPSAGAATAGFSYVDNADLPF